MKYERQPERPFKHIPSHHNAYFTFILPTLFTQRLLLQIISLYLLLFLFFGNITAGPGLIYKHIHTIIYGSHPNQNQTAWYHYWRDRSVVKGIGIPAEKLRRRKYSIYIWKIIYVCLKNWKISYSDILTLKKWISTTTQKWINYLRILILDQRICLSKKTSTHKCMAHNLGRTSVAQNIECEEAIQNLGGVMR